MTGQGYQDLFDRQLRGRLLPDHRDVVSYRDLSGLDEHMLDEFILAQRDRAPRTLEWTVHGHDEPHSLPERLRANGFVPESTETVMFAEVSALPHSAEPAGVRLREVSAMEDLERIQVLEETVWGIDHGWLPGALARALTGADGDPCVVVVAETPDGELVCAAWIRFHTGTSFASLWGGSTVESWRGKGIYRATVAYRAGLAAARGFELLRVDASPDSAPILSRLGFTEVTTITPYVWQPAETRSG